MITAKDMARRNGFATAKEWMLFLADQYHRRGNFMVMWDGDRVGGAPAMAFIDFERWGARCECGQHSFVDPDEPILFCPRCGNGNTGMARLVIFPPEPVRQSIERLLMARPVKQHPLAKDEIEAARLAKPIYGFLPRSWYPSETVEHLIEMNSMLGGT